MKEVAIEHLVDCDEGTYWDQCFFSEDYNQRLFFQTLKFSAWSQVITLKDDFVIKRTVESMPPVGKVPGPIVKLLGERFGYRERGTFDRKTRRYHLEIEPSAAADQVRIEGDIWLEKISAHQSKRIARMRVEVRIPFVGRMIEEKVIADMRHSYGRAAEFTSAWVRAHGPEKGLGKEVN